MNPAGVTLATLSFIRCYNCLGVSIQVHLVSEHIWCDDYLVRSFYLKNLQTNETRTVTQFHFLTWPHLSVPPSMKALLDFRRSVFSPSFSPLHSFSLLVRKREKGGGGVEETERWNERDREREQMHRLLDFPPL